MTLHRFARALIAVLIGATALVGSTGVASADPEDATPPIIEDLLIAIPGLVQGPSQDPRALDTPNNFGKPRDWTGSGMFLSKSKYQLQ